MVQLSVPVMEKMTEQQEIYKVLQDDETSTIILVGKKGIGKTWMAKQLRARAVRENLFEVIIWVSMNKKHENDLLKSIACQLPLTSTTKQWDGNEDEDYDSEGQEREERLDTLKQKLSSMLSQRTALLIMDGAGNDITEENIRSAFNPPLHSGQKKSPKVLITRSEPIATDISANEKVFMIKPLSEEEASSLLKERAEQKQIDITPIEYLLKAIVKASQGLPAKVLMMAETLSYLQQSDSQLWALQSALDEAAQDEHYNVKQLLWHDMCWNPVLVDCYWHARHLLTGHGSIHYKDLIVQWILEGYLGDVSSIEETYKEGHNNLIKLVDLRLLKKEGNDVIREGDLRLLKKEGNDVIREGDCTMDPRICGFGGTAKLGMADALEESHIEWNTYGRITRINGMIKSVNDKGEKNASMLLIDGYHLSREGPGSLVKFMERFEILALFNSKQQNLMFSLSNMHNLRALVLRGCTLLEEILIPKPIQAPTLLTVLEISGAKSLKNFPTDLFQNTPQLRSLNLSQWPTELLPSSIFGSLVELRWLILRGCSKLKELPSLNDLTKLEVIDLCGSASLEKLGNSSFSMLKNLKIINFSRTKLKRTPIVKGLVNLTHFLVSSCDTLTLLCKLDSLTSLQVLDLSGAANLVKLPANSFRNNDKICFLNLSGSRITQLPSIANFCSLEYLDVSKAKDLNKFDNISFENFPCLRVLNFSEIQVKKLPSISNLGNLRKLLLNSCAQLEELPTMEGLTRLEVLDLSGVSKLKEINDQHLNLRNLRHLLLPNCSSLEKLPCLSVPEKLEVLDLSGCSSLTEIKDDSFEHLSCLQRLSLSKTKVKKLPSLSNLGNLTHLLLRDCTSLQVLPSLDSLSRLENLDLSSASCLEKFQPKFLEHLKHLQILNLSGTPLKELPSMLNLSDLRQLSLRGCSDIKKVPNLEDLTKLEVLDLSGTAVEALPLEKLTNIRQLMLKNCSSLDDSMDLNVLDMLSPNSKKVPRGVSEMAEAKCICLPAMKHVPRVDNRMSEASQCQWAISNFSAEKISYSNKPHAFARGTYLIDFLKKSPELWETNFKKFHFSSCPIEQYEGGDIYFYNDELFYRSNYYQNGYCSDLMENDRSVELRGFENFPVGMEDILKHANCIFLVDSDFIKCLPDLCVKNMNQMKGCWIERCNKLKCILDAKEQFTLGKNLEILWLSNLPSLKSICNESAHADSFRNLRCLYLDCCPLLTYVFYPSQQLENLEVLQVKFCYSLGTIVNSGESAELSLSKLRTIHLWDLPELQSIGIKLTSLETFKIGQCPKLKNLEDCVKIARNVEILKDSAEKLKDQSLCLNLDEKDFSSIKLPENLEILSK
ncbi:NB-ARC [Dillenia turbinata]|uniref:NB-ARC n=1 Tax=Dillenia turbinata TaxID=194707 RepID=A0AAN8UKZ1_9MAGN